MEISTETETAKFASADSLLMETNALISLPEVCLKLREVIANTAHSRNDIADIIIQDPALTARILKIANSAYYGLSQSVRDISHALSILGERELNNLVIVTSIVKTMKSVTSTLDINSFWRSSIFTAVMAKNLAKHVGCNNENVEELFISGLLLNIGKLLLYYCEPELLEVVQDEMRESDRLDYEVEKEMLGFDHADVGAAMAKAWNFPPQFSIRISSHHQNVSKKISAEQSVMFSAAYLGDQLNFKFPNQISLDDINFVEAGFMKKLQLSEEKFCLIVNTSYEEYLQAFEALCGTQE
ncbi:MAG: HDOD domain-containing protein [Pseudohongiella sp.]|nr:HDOD domain-containing protein [Pseudohongiella sp.]